MELANKLELAIGGDHLTEYNFKKALSSFAKVSEQLTIKIIWK